MSISTVLRFLLGYRKAIVEVAYCPIALLVGGLFVLSAGFAREYDGEDLLSEPWYVGIPLLASLVSSFILHLVSSRKLLLRAGRLF